MTQNTIDLATAALNLNSSSDTASPGNTGICAGKPPFGQSLEEAMQTTDVNSATRGDDAEQLLPQAGQELPPQSADSTDLGGITEFRALADSAGLEGVTEVRALADAISMITREADQLTRQANNGLDNAILATSPNTSATSALSSTSGFYPSNFEAAKLDLDHEIGAFKGNPSDNINRQIMGLRETHSSGAYEPRINISDSVLIAETNNKEISNRSFTLDPPALGSSSMTQSESKLVNPGNAAQVSQQPNLTKPPEVVSSTELATHLRVLKTSGGGEARLQLHPAELGRMTVSLITEGDEARVSFVVDNSQAKQALEMSLPRLRDLMSEAGLSLTDADVSDRHAKENEHQPAERVTDETATNLGSDVEDLEEFTSGSSTQLVDTFA